MKKLKILFSMICAIAIISSLCVPAFAYSDGDREVLYYNFNIGTGELVGCSSSSMKRLYNREWVVTVTPSPMECSTTTRPSGTMRS